jgi:hypothetical protein
MLKHLRATYEHATKNVSKRRQSLLDRSHVFTPSTLSSSYVKLVLLMLNPNASRCEPKPYASDSDRLMTKANMLQTQSKSMAIVASCFSTTFDIQDTFLVTKLISATKYQIR